MVTPDAKRDAVTHACAVHGVSQRRACEALEIDRSSVRYRSIRAPDLELREAMKAVATERRRFGYRRIHVMLERQGIVMNIKKLRRLYSEEKLQVRKRGGRKRALGTRRPMLVPDRPNQRWSLDFVSDSFTDGRRFRVLTVVDDHTRECLAPWPTPRCRVARRTRSGYGHRPAWTTSNGGQRQRHRVYQHGHPALVPGPRNRLALHRSRQAYAERLHRELQWQLPRRVPQRDAVLVTARGPRPYIEWKEDYNSQRPHSSLGKLTPDEFTRKLALEKQAVRATHQPKDSPQNRRELGAQVKRPRAQRRKHGGHRTGASYGNASYV
jgi:putative transposase